MLRMTVAVRHQDSTRNIPYGVHHEDLSPSDGMSSNGKSFVKVDAWGQYSRSKSRENGGSSVEGDCSPRDARSMPGGPALPPLHPPSQSQLFTSIHSQTFSQRCRTLSSDTMASTGSSVVSIDAGKHGFITHDDASATGSLVLAYEPGKEVPPAEYDLPKAILGLDFENRSVAYSVESKEEFHKLPYQIRSRLSLSQTDKIDLPPDNRRWSNIPDVTAGYGAVEEGMMQKKNRENGKYPSPGDGSTSANTMCYSSETRPFFDRGGGYTLDNFPIPEQLQMPMPSTWVSEEHQQIVNKKEDTSNNQAAVYFSMFLILILFVGIVYGLFFIMKMMA